MKYYELHLPVFKQGSDLGGAIEQNDGDLPKAFEGMAETYESAAEMCRKMAAIAVEHELQIEADTHMIQIFGPNDVLEKLESDGLLYSYDNDE